MIFGKRWLMTLCTPWVKNLVGIALSYTISETDAFSCFTQKFKVAAKMAGGGLYIDLLGQKCCQNRSMSHCV